MRGIYCIQNKKSGKLYIGSSKNIEKRIRGHKNSLRLNRHYNIYLQRAYNKYGEGGLVFKSLERTTEKNMINREQFWIDKYKSHIPKNGYNINPIANGSPMLNPETVKKVSKTLKGRGKGRKLSEKTLKKLRRQRNTKEWRERISAVHKGKKLSKEHRRKIAIGNKGKVVSKETRRRISIARKGIIFSEETREKMRNNNLGRKHSEETKRKMSLAMKGKLLGIKHSEKRKKSNSLAQKKLWKSKEHREKMLLAHKGRKRKL